MPWAKIRNLDQFGWAAISATQAPAGDSITFPPNAWTDMLNACFDYGAIRPTCGLGYSGSAVSPSFPPYGLIAGERKLLILGLAKAQGYSAYSTSYDVTRVAGDYTGTIYDLWNGGVLNAVFYANNGVDKPQVWMPPYAATPMTDLPNWPATYRCKVMRHFKNYLMALDVTESGTRNARRVVWSHPADPGTVPSSWDITDPTKDAGDVTLAEGDDPVIDCLPLSADVNVIYTNTAAYAQTLSGSGSIFNFARLVGIAGMASQQCAIDLGGKHFVLTNDDAVVHDGRSIASVAERKIRRYLADSFSTSVSMPRVHVAKNQAAKEVWCFFPGSGTTDMCYKIFVWNWESGHWGYKQIDFNTLSISHAILHQRPPVSTPNARPVLLAADPVGSKVYAASILGCADGSLVTTKTGTPTVRFARANLTIASAAPDGTPLSDATIMKQIIGLRLIISDRSTNVFNVQVTIRYRNEEDTASSTWFDNWVVGTTKLLCPNITCRFFDIEFVVFASSYTGSTSSMWQFIGYDLEVVPLGRL